MLKRSDRTTDKKDPVSDTGVAKIAPEFEGFQNPLKVFHHTQRIHELRSTGDTRMVHMTVGLTNYCNHKCPWCSVNWKQAGRASERSGAGKPNRKPVNASPRLIEAIGEARDMGLKAVTIVGNGEPTLHPDFAEILGRLGNMGLEIGLFTNMSVKGRGIPEALVQHCFFIRASIDAATSETHRYSHGAGDFDRVVANLRSVLELRGDARRPFVGVQYVTSHRNVNELPDAARFFREVGVDYLSIKPAYKVRLNVAHPENKLGREQAFAAMREAEGQSTAAYKVFAKYPQFEEVIGHKTNDGRYYRQCLATPLAPYLDEDGTVEMCGNLKGHGFSMGNIHQASFQEIWSSKRRRDCLGRIEVERVGE